MANWDENVADSNDVFSISRDLKTGEKGPAGCRNLFGLLILGKLNMRVKKTTSCRALELGFYALKSLK